ncbi:unnamed protein product [Clonostachys solani]|uniref:Uncharacterized protein n=1 Tax=Clonostachys solani TaxID=160281 RepID=A0A9N9Z7B2_9HYPO|nr:unnamed protein product [Clonostachys solani]
MSLPITLESSSVKSVLDDQTLEGDEYNPNSQTRPHSNGSGKKQEKPPKDPRKVQEARSGLGQSTENTHAKDGREILPEDVERAVPNVVHGNRDTGGLHRNH